MPPNVASETDISGDSTTNRSVFLTPMLNPAGLAPRNPLALGEILGLIFQFASRRSLAAAARVCRRWSGIALDQLWRSLPDLYCLLSLLAEPEWIQNPMSYKK
ncbi:hypothetical protein FRC04_001159, partial [Tulasnella sp. 424]